MSMGLAPLGTASLGLAPGDNGPPPAPSDNVAPALHTIAVQFQPGPGIGQGLHPITEQVTA